MKPFYYAINCSLWCSQIRDFEKFPVKFPVSRENEQSRGDSSLPRQPSGTVFEVFPYNAAKKPAGRGLLASGKYSVARIQQLH